MWKEGMVMKDLFFFVLVRGCRDCVTGGVVTHEGDRPGEG